MTIALKKNVPGFRDANGVFRPIRSASYVGGGSSRRKATAKDRKKYSRAKAGDLGKAKQERALEAPWDRDARLEREAKAAEKREQDRITRELEREIYGETSGRTSRGKGRSLAQFIRSEGGINTRSKVRKGRVRYGDSLENFTRKGSGSTGLVTTTPGKGKSLDYMHQAAREAGYDVASMDDLLDALDNEIRSGKKTYSTHGSMTYNPAKKLISANAADLAKARKLGKASEGLSGEKYWANWNMFRDLTHSKPFSIAAIKKLHDAHDKAKGDEARRVLGYAKRNPAKFNIGDIAYLKWQVVGAVQPGAKTLLSGSRVIIVAKSSGRYMINGADKLDRWVDAEYLIKQRPNPAAKKNPKSQQLHEAILKDFLKEFDEDRSRVYDVTSHNGYGFVRMSGGREYWCKLTTRGVKKNSWRLDIRNNPAVKKNPDLLSMFANAAVGIASTLQINEMVKRKTRRTAPKKRGKTTAKATKRRSNPLAGEGKASVTAAKKLFTEKLAEIRKYPSRDVIGSANSLIGYITTTAAGKAALRKRIKAATAAGLKTHPTASGRSVNPSQPNLFKSKGPKGDLYVLTIGSGDDLVSVYLHDGDKDGFSKRFKTLAAARAYATRNKVKMVENPAAAKVNGIIKRAWARSRAKSEYGRELRQAAALERTRQRRQKAEQAARLNPAKDGWQKFGRTGWIYNLGGQTFGQVTRQPVGGVWSAWRRSDNAIKHFGTLAEAKRFAGNVTEKANPKAVGKMSVNRRTVKKTFKRAKAIGRPRKAIDAKARKSLTLSRAETKSYSRTKANPRSAIRNPRSSARRRTFEMFQGRKVTTARPMIVSNHAPANLDQLGDLIELKIAGGPTLKFNGKTAKLCAANGKLWIAGKRFAKANPAAAANEINPIGEIDHVVYGTRKPHHGDHDYTHYIHKLGEESGRRPILCVDREGFPVIRGGNYKIEARGIVD